MSKVSICVPVYNVEQYIGRCIESIQNQTLTDIEIIVVNDCTPDSSMQIVRDYAKNDPRIRIIEHDVNHGLMWARRTGYMAATGDYITFCDSDDALPNDAIEKLYKAAIENDADISSGNLQYVRTRGKTSILISDLKYGDDKVGIYKSLLKLECGHNLCSKMFKRNILQNNHYFTYEHFTNGEDGCLFYQVVDNCRRMVQIPEIVYLYYQNTESSSQVRYSNRGIRSICLLNKTRVDICSKYNQLANLVYACVSVILNNLISNGYDKDKYLSECIKEYNLTEYITPHLMFQKLRFVTFCKLMIKRNVKPILKK